MNGSKWSYVGVGTSVMCAFMGALIHSGVALVIGIVFTIYNWYTGEYARRLEDEALIAAYKLSIEEKENSHE
jgi:hypothetical protein